MQYFTGADVLLKDLPPAAAVMEYDEYDRDTIRRMLAQQGIPPRCCRKKPVHDHKKLDRRHHKIETLFSRQKDWRRLATRYDGCAHGLLFCHPSRAENGGTTVVAGCHGTSVFQSGKWILDFVTNSVYFLAVMDCLPTEKQSRQDIQGLALIVVVDSRIHSTKTY